MLGSRWALTAVLTIGGWLAAPPAKSAEWVAAGTPLMRSQGTLTTLPDGNVIAIGGSKFDATALVFVPFPASEIFDPTKTTWTTAASMLTPRLQHMAVATEGGVLIFGGKGDAAGYSAGGTLLSVEMYDAAKKTFRSVGKTLRARAFAAVVALPDGRVLLAGGMTGETMSLADAEIFDPKTGTSKLTPKPKHTSGTASGLLLPDGRVFVAGDLATDIFDPATNTWTDGPVADVGAYGATSYLLPDGRVFLIDEVSGESEAIDLASGKGTVITLAQKHSQSAQFQLQDGRVVVAGGNTALAGSISTDVVEIFDPKKNGWEAGPPLDGANSGYDVAVLRDGRALLKEGSDALMLQLFVGAKCSAEDQCGNGLCVDGRCCESACNGACVACDVAGSEGKCVAIDGASRKGHTTCAPYNLCAAGACRSDCAGDEDCADGNVCFASGSCAPPRAHCDGDHTVTDLGSGQSADCAPYKCRSSGDCIRTCASSADCASGAACAEGTCVAATPEADSGGCAAGANKASTPAAFSLGMLGLGALGLMSMRRRARTANSKRVR